MATNINKPEVTLNIIGEQGNINNTAQKILVFGQITTGSATAGTMVTGVQESDLASVFGNYSNTADMVRNIRKINKVTQIDVMPFADGTTAATATIQATAATITVASTMYVSIGSSVDHQASVTLGVGDSVNTIATNIAAAINAMHVGPSLCPFTATSSTDTVTVTCVQKGKVGNTMSIQLLVDNSAGATFLLTPFASGADSLTLNGYFSSISGRYQNVVWPFSANDTDVKIITQFLEPRINASKKVLDGQSFASMLNPSTDQTVAINSRTLTILASAPITSGGYNKAVGADICEKEYAKAAQVAAIRALRLTDNANLTPYQTTTAAADQFGGMGISTLPYFNTLLPNMPQSGTFGYTDAQQATLKAKGYSFIGNNGGSGVVIGDLITTYAFDNGGNADDSWTNLENVDAMSVAREYFFNNLKKRFAQSRLTGGKTVARRSMADKESIEAYCARLNQELGDEAIVELGQTTVDGVTIDAEQSFLDNLSVILSTSAGSATINGVLLIVGQLRTILGTLQLSFSS